MSLHEYLQSQQISEGDPQFFALLMSMFRKADTFNLAALKSMWPEVWAEFHARYKSPGGRLAGDPPPKEWSGSRDEWASYWIDGLDTREDG
jgi:hypothetical protein